MPDEDPGGKNTSALLLKMYITRASIETSMAFPQKSKGRIFIWPGRPLLGIHSREWSLLQGHLHTPVYYGTIHTNQLIITG